jgi:hypothetical protein
VYLNIIYKGYMSQLLRTPYCFIIASFWDSSTWDKSLILLSFYVGISVSMIAYNSGHRYLEQPGQSYRSLYVDGGRWSTLIFIHPTKRLPISHPKATVFLQLVYQARWYGSTYAFCTTFVLVDHPCQSHIWTMCLTPLLYSQQSAACAHCRSKPTDVGSLCEYL